MSRFADFLIVLLIFQVTFNPFTIANAQFGIIPGLIPGSTGLIPEITGLLPGITSLLPGITGLVPGITGLVPGILGGSVIGQLCCPGTRATCPGSGIANVPVFLNCTSILGTVVLGQTTTNVNGLFNIMVPNLSNFISNPLGSAILSCNVTAQLPLNSAVCPTLNTANGLLVSAVGFVGTLLTSTFGLIQVFVTINGFSIVPLALL